MESIRSDAGQWREARASIGGVSENIEASTGLHSSSLQPRNNVRPFENVQVSAATLDSLPFHSRPVTSEIVRSAPFSVLQASGGTSAGRAEPASGGTWNTRREVVRDVRVHLDHAEISAVSVGEERSNPGGGEEVGI